MSRHTGDLVTMVDRHGATLPAVPDQVPRLERLGYRRAQAPRPAEPPAAPDEADEPLTVEQVGDATPDVADPTSAPAPPAPTKPRRRRTNKEDPAP